MVVGGERVSLGTNRCCSSSSRDSEERDVRSGGDRRRNISGKISYAELETGVMTDRDRRQRLQTGLHRLPGEEAERVHSSREGADYPPLQRLLPGTRYNDRHRREIRCPRYGRGFFNAGRLTVSGTRLAHLRDLLTYIARHLGSSRDQDKLLDVRDSITKDRFPEDAFNADGNKEKDP